MKIKDERKELEDMLDKSPKEINKNVPSDKDIPEIQSEPLIDVDINELNIQCEKEARIMIVNAIAFMIPPDMIDTNKYLQNKLEVDIMSLAGMIYQLRLNQIVQKTLTQQISLGLTHARYFEVFSGMAKTIGELNKQLIQTTEAIKETYRTFKNDVKEQRTEALGPSTSSQMGMITTGDGGIVTRGTKELINNVKRLKNQNGNDQFIDEAELIKNINFDASSMNI